MKTLLYTLLALLLLPACERASTAVFEQADGPEVVPAVILAEDLSPESLYQLDAAWTDQTGAAAQLQQLRGRPVVMTFVYTYCGATCPLLVHNMKLIGQALSPEAQAQTAFVLVSLDPERDTPEQLQKFARAHGLDRSAWTLLRGDLEDVRALAASVSVGFRNQSDGQIAHANLLTILNAEGEVVQQVPGSGATAEAAAVLDSLVLASR